MFKSLCPKKVAGLEAYNILIKYVGYNAEGQILNASFKKTNHVRFSAVRVRVRR